jgi:hypothetical protein
MTKVNPLLYTIIMIELMFIFLKIEIPISLNLIVGMVFIVMLFIEFKHQNNKFVKYSTLFFGLTAFISTIYLLLFKKN